MVGDSVQTVTVDSISNAGNALAQQKNAGKAIHVPAGELGETYEVRLEDKGGYLIAHLTDRADEVQPRQPSIDRGPDTSEIGRSIIDRSRKSAKSHSHEVRSCPAGGKLRSTPHQEEAQARRSEMAQKKL